MLRAPGYLPLKISSDSDSLLLDTRIRLEHGAPAPATLNIYN